MPIKQAWDTSLTTGCLWKSVCRLFSYKTSLFCAVDTILTNGGGVVDKTFFLWNAVWTFKISCASLLQTREIKKLDKLDKLEKLDKLDKLEKLEKLDKLDKLEKLEKLEKLDKLDKSDKLEKLFWMHKCP